MSYPICCVKCYKCTRRLAFWKAILTQIARDRPLASRSNRSISCVLHWACVQSTSTVTNLLLSEPFRPSKGIANSTGPLKICSARWKMLATWLIALALAEPTAKCTVEPFQSKSTTTNQQHVVFLHFSCQLDDSKTVVRA